MAKKKTKSTKIMQPKQYKKGPANLTGIIKPRNEAQKLYLQLLRESKLVLCAGAAGTGKTFLSTYIALEKLMDGEVDKIIITRPIVEAGEKLGFLPGTFEEKVNPYLLPIMDSLEDHVGIETVRELIADGVIEIAPLAYMRGRSLKYCILIGDELENSTKEQMKMLLTRIGKGSFFFINGDITQSDLNIRSENGMEWVMNKINPCEDIGKIEFARKDIVRSPLIEKILNQLDD